MRSSSESLSSVRVLDSDDPNLEVPAEPAARQHLIAHADQYIVMHVQLDVVVPRGVGCTWVDRCSAMSIMVIYLDCGGHQQ